MITRSALVEQAHSLAEYEIDSSEKYKDAFGLKDLDALSDSETSLSEASVQRILRHHEKIVAIKSQKATATSPPQLVSILRSLYGSDLLKNVLHHKAFDKDEMDNPKNDGILESIIGDVCRDFCDGLKEDALHGLLLAVLSVLTGLNHDGTDVPDLSKGKAESRAIERRQDPSDVPALQVGAILSLMRSNVEKGPFSLDEKVLTYLGDAASAYEDRIDVQKARLVARAEQEESKVVRVDRKQQKTGDASIGGDDNTSIPIAPFVPTDASDPSAVFVEDGSLQNHEEQDVEGNDPDEEDEDEDEEGCDDDDDDDIGNDLLRPTVFNQIISAVADGVDRAALRLAAGGIEHDSSDSDSTNDNDSDHNLDRYTHDDNAPHVELDDESSSSDEEEESEPSPEVVDDDDDDNEGEDEDDDDDDDDDAGDSILRQALALSLSDHLGFAEAPGSNLQGCEGPEDDKDNEILLNSPKRESRRSSRSKFDHSDSDRRNLTDVDALPDLPIPPSFYPYWSSLDSVTDVDDKSDPAVSLHLCLDPSELSKFGTVPSSLALVRLLQNTLGVVTGHLAQERKQRSGEYGIKPGTVPGGMGCMLFGGSEAHISDDRKGDLESEFNRTAAFLQLLVATVLLCFESRKEAIEGLREAISMEQRNAQGEDEARAGESDDHDGNDTPLSDDDEQDNNAVTLAMRLRYPSDGRNFAASVRSTSSQAESLESKGMSRKAAAAGWDAAMRIKSLKKKTDAWKNRVKLYSYCTLLSLKSFRTYMQFCVSGRLDRIDPL